MSYHCKIKSHDLRSYVETTLQLMNVSPYIIEKINGHAVPGRSKVVAAYVAPTQEQIREVLERLS